VLRVAKGAGLIVLSLALLAVLVVGAILATFDANRFKPEFIALGRHLSGRDFDIAGDLSLKLSLSPTVIARRVKLGNMPSAKPDAMLDIAHFEARVQLLPLLQHRLIVHELRLSGANIDLQRDHDGVANWTFAERLPAVSAAPANSLEMFDLKKVSLKDSRIKLHWFGAPSREIFIDSLTLEPDGKGLPLRLRSKMRLAGQAFSVSAKLAPLERLFANENYAVELRVALGDYHFTITGAVAEPLLGRGMAFDFSGAVRAHEMSPQLFSNLVPDLAEARISGRVRDDDGAYLFDGLQVSLEQSALTAQARLELGGVRPALAITFSAEHLDMRIFDRMWSNDAETQRLFSTTALEWERMALLDLDIDGSIARVKTPSMSLGNVRFAANLVDSKLALTEFSALLERGTVAATLRIDAGQEIPRFEHTLALENVSMAPLVKAANAIRFRGDHVALALDLKSVGSSLAEIAQNASGNIRFSVRDLDIASRDAAIVSGDVLLQAFRFLNPLASHNSDETIECAEFNFPLRAGRALAATGIGMRTDKLNILGGGEIDFGRETLDLGVSAKAREGFGLNIAGFADFIRIGGTLREPRPTTDAGGALLIGAKVGAAIASGGLSLLAEGLLDRSQSDLDVCAIAAGTVALPSASARAQSELSNAADTADAAIKRAGKTLQGGFNRLFSE